VLRRQLLRLTVARRLRSILVARTAEIFRALRPRLPKRSCLGVTDVRWLLLPVLALTATGCGPEQTALVAATRSGSEPAVVVVACDGQPRLTVRVHYGTEESQSYTLTGPARAGERELVLLTSPPTGWTLTGSVMPLDPRSRITADVEDGDGLRLDAAVSFTVDELPTAPLVKAGSLQRGKTPSDLSSFDRTASHLCDG
jgi:hypothetical protein